VGGKTGVDEQEGARQSLPPATLSAMREDYALVVANRRAEQGWSDEDVEEFGHYIADAKADPAAAEAWRLYLATEAAVIRRRAEACRAAEARVLAERANDRLKAAA
jgi:hypothetical protein